MIGRPPKPTTLKILAGNPGKRELNAAEPRPEQGNPDSPEWLDAESRAAWDETIAVIGDIGVLTLADKRALAHYCQACGLAVRAGKELEKNGSDYVMNDTTGHIHAHPAVGVLNKALATARAYSALFGLDPAARSRIVASPGKSEPVDPLDELLAAEETA